MKRHGNLFEQIISMENLRLAFGKACKGKRWQDTVKQIEENLEDNLLKLQESLINKTFHTSPYRTKTIHEPKKRDIFILPFYPDRIVQHAILNILEPIWDKLFVYHSYACRKNKGQHKGSTQVMKYISGKHNLYCLQGDISKFYPSINHDILSGIIKDKIKCKDTLWLLNDIIYSIQGDKNVPIGNYTSQWFGNLYMNKLDHLLKHKYKIKRYIRYCDDFVLFSESKEFLNEMKGVITTFVREELQIGLSKCSIFPVTQGIDFIGYRHFSKGYILLRKATTKRVKKRIKKLPWEYRRNKITIEQMQSSIASTRGWLQWANTHNLQLKLSLDSLVKEMR